MVNQGFLCLDPQPIRNLQVQRPSKNIVFYLVQYCQLVLYDHLQKSEVKLTYSPRDPNTFSEGDVFDTVICWWSRRTKPEKVRLDP